MLGDCRIVNHFFAWTAGNRGNRSIRASSLLGSFLFGVPLPAAGLYIVDTASLTDLSPFITMSLRTITTSVAQGRGSQGGYRSAPGWSMCGAQGTYDKNHRDNQRIGRGGMNEPLRIVEISDYL
jgi:hypothetical protein